MKQIENTYQQGDVLLRKLNEIPNGKRKIIAKGKCVLAHGESGHTHVVEQDDAELIQIGDRILLTITEPAQVKHGEHHTRTLSPGIWEIGSVNEFDWFLKMKRKVID